MNIKKPLIIAGMAATLGLATAGYGVASAAHSPGGDGLAAKIAQNNLQQDEVQAVIDEERATHKVEMQQRLSERLDAAVEEGELTEDQKAKILAKLEELRSQAETRHEAWQDMTDEQRREAKKQLHEELKQWAEDNDIPLKYLHFKVHMGGMGQGFVKHLNE